LNLAVSYPAAWLAENITWVRVEKPTFDLGGVLLASLQIVGSLLVVAILLGSFFGLLLLAWRRRKAESLGPVSLQLEPRA
jgi:hypothetical protein